MNPEFTRLFLKSITPGEMCNVVLDDINYVEQLDSIFRQIDAATDEKAIAAIVRKFGQTCWQQPKRPIAVKLPKDWPQEDTFTTGEFFGHISHGIRYKNPEHGDNRFSNAKLIAKKLAVVIAALDDLLELAELRGPIGNKKPDQKPHKKEEYVYARKTIYNRIVGNIEVIISLRRLLTNPVPPQEYAATIKEFTTWEERLTAFKGCVTYAVGPIRLDVAETFDVTK